MADSVQIKVDTSELEKVKESCQHYQKHSKSACKGSIHKCKRSSS